ncbi:sensor domain-containing diguanylate cyclase [Virgisporangium aurantiacum]|uniref:GGDEF domain-containing protein n=1 Tax=Virgisporangium aurantiacum TaxID=175570 RepID=A0A8J3Z8I3_9ACTN|nr:GGDEF domain-containing protein [Virgisporangium aurantiacum]GIJ59326.1 hypothetical protein Vau01_068420 [Virgisporangium aurantiacum]
MADKRLATAFPIGWAVLFWALSVAVLTVPGIPDDLYGPVMSLLYVPVAVLAGMLSRRKRLDTGSRRAWLCLCVGFSSVVIGAAMDNALSAVFAVVGSIGGVVGLLAFPSAGRAAGRRGTRTLDALIAFTGAFMACWTFIVVPRWNELTPSDDRVGQIVVLCLSFTILAVAVGVLVGRPAPHVARTVRTFALGMVVLTGVGFVVDVLRITGPWMPVVLSARGIGCVLFTVAAVDQLAGVRWQEPGEPATSPGPAPRAARLSPATMAPYGFVVIGYLVLIWKTFEGSSGVMLNGLVVLATIATLLVTVRQGSVLVHSARLQAALHFQAHHDELTGAMNRRALFAETNRLAGTPYSALVIDVDHFKGINDTFGHNAGDEALRAIVGVIRGRLRATDLLCRLGGDEFAVVLPGVGTGGAASLAADLQAGCRSSTVSAPVTLSLSIGIAAGHRDPDGLDAVLTRADEALYEAKRAGRGCHRVYPGEPAPMEPLLHTR